MVITYHGENYFKLQVGEQGLLINPTNQRSYKGSSAIIFTTFSKEEPVSDIEIPTFTHQGEYEVNSIPIRGWTAGNEKGTEHTAYKMVFDEIKIGVLLSVGESPSAEIIESLQESDILFISVGDKNTFSSSDALKTIRALEPGILIPSFNNEKEKTQFLKELGKEGESVDRLTIKKKDIGKGAMSLVLLHD